MAPPDDSKDLSPLDPAQVTLALAQARKALGHIQSALPTEEGFGIGLFHQYYAEALRNVALIRQLESTGALPAAVTQKLGEELSLSTGPLDATFKSLSKLADETSLGALQGSGVIARLHQAMGQLIKMIPSLPPKQEADKAIADYLREQAGAHSDPQTRHACAAKLGDASLELVPSAPAIPAIQNALANLAQAHDIIVTHGLNQIYPEERLYADRRVEKRMDHVSATVGLTSFASVNFEILSDAAQPMGKAARLIEEARLELEKHNVRGLLPPPIAKKPAQPLTIDVTVQPTINDTRLTNPQGRGILDKLRSAQASLSAALKARAPHVNPADILLVSFLEDRHYHSGFDLAMEYQSRFDALPKPTQVYAQLKKIHDKTERAHNLIEAFAVNRANPSAHRYIDDAARLHMEDIYSSVDPAIFAKNHSKYLAVVQPIGESIDLLRSAHGDMGRLTESHRPSAALKKKLAPAKGKKEPSYAVKDLLTMKEVLAENGLPESLAKPLLVIGKMGIGKALPEYINSNQQLDYEDFKTACRHDRDFLRKHKTDAHDLQMATWLDPDDRHFNPARARAKTTGGFQHIGEQLTDAIQYGLDTDFGITLREVMTVAEKLGNAVPESLTSAITTLKATYEAVLAVDLNTAYPEWKIPRGTLPVTQVLRHLDKAASQIADQSNLVKGLDKVIDQLTGNGYQYQSKKRPPLRQQVETFLSSHQTSQNRGV